MLVGLAGAGKSTYAKTFKGSYTIHSSDDLRKEMFGDENENSKENNEKLFTELHKRIKDDLRKGVNVIYDATNLNRKRRIAFLRELTKIPCYKTCLLVMAPYYLCLRNNQQRLRHVPVNAIRRMYMNFQPPNKNEGWDDIDIIFSCSNEGFKDYTFDTLYNRATGIDYFNQGNKHHALTLGEHSRKVAEYILKHYPGNKLLHLSALLHDEGKVFTMTTVNAKGISDGECHYYQHNCVGAYDSIFYMYNMDYHVDDIIHVASLIYFHMFPYFAWKDMDENKIRETLGERLYDEIIALHKADESAH